jgi:hypothetical protein
MIVTRHVAHVGGRNDSYRILVKRLEGKRQPGRLRIRLKQVFMKWNGKTFTAFP